jgi:hypothetical protein
MRRLGADIFGGGAVKWFVPVMCDARALLIHCNMQLDPSLTVISLPQVAGQCMPCAQCGRSSSITSECDACAAPYFPADDAGAACSAEEGQGGTRGAYIHVVAAVYAQEQLPFSYLVRKPSICERERERERERGVAAPHAHGGSQRRSAGM